MDTHGGNDTIICGGNDRKILTDPLETVLRDEGGVRGVRIPQYRTW